MDYEQKYKEAFERAKGEWVKNLDNAYKNYRERLEIIFPELKEKDDEKAKRIILALPFKHEADYKFVKTWLEKQGYTKKDIDDAYLKGICDTKHELEKQGKED